MKKFLFLLAAVAAFAFAGCEKEKGNENDIDGAYIAGLWNNDGRKYFQFNEDGSGQMASIIDGEEGYVDIRWTLDGTKLTVTTQDSTKEVRPSGTFVYTVVKLTSTTLELKVIIEDESAIMQFTRG